MNFTPDFFNVGNIEGNLSALGLCAEDIEIKVNDMVDELKYKYGLCVPHYIVTNELQERNIPYEYLPQYLIDKIDELEVY